MRRLHVDLKELIFAFDQNDYEINYFLDVETGAVELVTAETLRELEKLYEREEDENLTSEELPPEEQEAIAVARAIEEDEDDRYLPVPKMETRDAYDDMRSFITTVRDPRLQEQLERAISGRGAFRYFKDVLQDYPKERERWFAYKDEQMRERVIEWLRDEGIEPIEK